MDSLTTIREALATNRWTTAPPDTAERLVRYLDAVLERNTFVNLTGPVTKEAAIGRHLVDSLALGLHLAEEPRKGPLRVVDLGTGGGFPGVPVAAADPRLVVHVLDGRGKKILAVQHCLSEAGIEGVRAHHARLSEWAKTEKPFDLVLARAVAPLAKLLTESAECLARGGTLVAWKALAMDPLELIEGDAEAARRHFERLPDLVYESDVKRRLVRYQKGSR